MSDDNANTLYAHSALVEALLFYEAHHKVGCPQRQQNYWRLRPEYRPPGHVDKPCTCKLDEIIGHPDNRAQ